MNNLAVLHDNCEATSSNFGYEIAFSWFLSVLVWVP